MGYNLLIYGVYWGYNPLTNLLPTSWDIQVRMGLEASKSPIDREGSVARILRVDCCLLYFPGLKLCLKHPAVKGQWGVPLTVYPWYLLCSLGILGDYNP